MREVAENILHDLKKRVVKAIRDPDHRFCEDHLRMLRAVRFAHTLDFDLDPKTYKSIKKMLIRFLWSVPSVLKTNYQEF